jgi:hypothetical protein
MKNILLTLLTLFAVIACKQQETATDYTGTWLQIKKTGNNYVMVNCGYPGESIEATATTVLNKGTMEDFEFIIDHIEAQDNSITLYGDTSAKNYYKFTWVNKQEGIAQWDSKYEGTPIVTGYYVTQAGSKQIKKVKGDGTDCITHEDVGDVVNDTFTTANGEVTLTIENGNCISLKDKAVTQLYENCYEVNFVELRKAKGNFLPLTFISGKNAIDIDFYKEGNEWISKKATFYSPETGKAGKTENTVVNLKEFDFETVAAPLITNN